MADIYGSYFEFGGVSSVSYDLIIANVETERFESLYGQIQGNFFFNKKVQKNYLINDDYSSSPLSFDIEIVRNDAASIPADKQREIEKWLFNRPVFKKLYPSTAEGCEDDMVETIDGVEKRLYLNCRLINPEKIEYGSGVMGYRCTLEADTGMMYQDEITKTINLTNNSASSTSTFTVDVDTDQIGYVYPEVTIRMGASGGTVILTNNTDDSARITKFEDLGSSAIVTLKGEINYVSGQYYEKFTGKNFVRMLDGTNGFTVIGDVSSITMKYQNRRGL